MPEDWPPGTYDLVVVSEVGYFLAPDALDRLVDRVSGSVERTGWVVLCHWRHPVDGWVLDGAAVHRAFESRAGWVRCGGYRDRDVEILLLGSPDQLPDPAR